MSAGVLWGVLAITAFSVAGFGLFAAGGLIARLPERFRTVLSVAGTGLYAALLSYGLHQFFFRADRGLVAQGHLDHQVATIVWGVLSLLIAAIALRRASRTRAASTNSTGTGASA